ncbi:MFS transporter [Nocardia africana]|uniref:MFS transporter n=1 Tax=Nocardia africana TaxID=134964 RepID=A0ABW6NV44_9NOCA
MTRAADRREVPSITNRPNPNRPRHSRLAALQSRNFRLYLSGQASATTGLWVQRIAQDWLVLTLTGSAYAVGVTTALQWAPMLVFGMVGGWIADHCSKRRVLQATQTAAASIAAALAALTLTHHVMAWHVQLLAAALGAVAAIERPVRSAFVPDLVETSLLSSAISVSFSVFYLGNFAGPAISGVLITAIGPGWAFAFTAFSYIVPLIALACIDSRRLQHLGPALKIVAPSPSLRTLLLRPQIWRPIMVGGVFGMFTYNLPVILTSYANNSHAGPAGYSLLTSSLALGSVVGGFISASRTTATLRTIGTAAYCLAGTYVVAAAMPTVWALGGVLAVLGVMSTLLFTATNTTVQLAVGSGLRGRILALYIVVETGSAAIGGPILGLIVQHLGSRTGIFLAGAVPAAVLLLVTVAGLGIRNISGKHGSTSSTTP